MKFLTKYFLPGLAGLFLVVAATHYIWTYSGDGEWKLIEDTDGVKVYTKKNPGDPLLKIKSNMVVDTRLSTAVYALRGDETTSEDFDGEDFRVIEKIETPDMYMGIYSVKQVMPDPLGTKEIVMMLNYAQNKETGAVVINVQGVPGIIPPTPNVERVKRLNNTFNVKPLADGKVHWEMIMDVDIGLPYPLFNLAMPAMFVKEMSSMRDIVKTEKYRNVELVSIVEP